MEYKPQGFRMRGIQNAISKNLSYFDAEAKEIEVITDASQHGLCAQLSMMEQLLLLHLTL